MATLCKTRCATGASSGDGVLYDALWGPTAVGGLAARGAVCALSGLRRQQAHERHGGA